MANAGAWRAVPEASDSDLYQPTTERGGGPVIAHAKHLTKGIARPTADGGLDTRGHGEDWRDRC